MKFETLLTRETANYKLLLQALKGIYLPRVMPGQEVTPIEIKSLKKDATIVVDEFGKRLKDAITKFKKELGFETSDYDLEYGPQLVSLLNENILSVVTAMRESRADLAKMLQGGDHGAVGEIIKSRIVEPVFEARDTGGRKWNAEKLFFFLLRNYLYFMEVSAEIQKIKNSGKDLARIVYPDRNHKSYGLVFSISGESSKHQSLKSVKKLFHYNSNAMVEPLCMSPKTNA